MAKPMSNTVLSFLGAKFKPPPKKSPPLDESPCPALELELDVKPPPLVKLVNAPNIKPPYHYENNQVKDLPRQMPRQLIKKF